MYVCMYVCIYVCMYLNRATLTLSKNNIATV